MVLIGTKLRSTGRGRLNRLIGARPGKAMYANRHDSAVNLHCSFESFVDYHTAQDNDVTDGEDMKKRRHTTAEIEALLDRAEGLSAEGRRHGDIAKALGVSVMTYHRWRKARGPSSLAVGSGPGTELTTAPVDKAARITELQLENLRLRRLVTDLLLEKMNLEEGLRGRAGKTGSALGF